MIISLNSIKQFTTLPPLNSNDIAQRLTEASCEVEHVTALNGHLEQVVSVKILTVSPHPESEHLNLVTFHDGKGNRMVVCGAPNVKVGLVTAFAPLGTTLPNGLTLEAKKIRGVMSEGMLCSAQELGLGTSHEGIIELEPLTALGSTMTSLFKQEGDTLFEIDNKSITNRSDLWGFYGMAYEMAALFNQPFSHCYNEAWLNDAQAKHSNQQLNPVAITIDPKSSCIGYSALSIDGVDDRPSPLWMQNRLLSLGMRPINALVDVSNYVMLELGIPTHFYDRSKIAGNSITVTTLKADELFTTLDDKERALTAGDTVIRDSKKPLIIAAIMGGKNSMVDELTRSILIESAVWQAEEVRKTGLRIGLRTDSSVRYEKSLDANLIERTLWRCVELISQIFPESHVVGKPFVHRATEKMVSYPYSVEVPINRFNSVMGLELTTAEADAILQRLGFTTLAHQDSLTVSPPSWRSTKEQMASADIFEEIARIYGYSRIKMAAPLWPLEPINMPPRVRFERKIQDFFVLHGKMLEIFTHPMTGELALKKALWPTLNGELAVANSVSPEHDRMRPSLIPSMLDACELNQKNFSVFRCFEYGRAFLPHPENFGSDRYRVAVMLFNRKESPFLEMADLIERLFSFMAINGSITMGQHNNAIVSQTWQGLHPNECATITINQEPMGIINSVHPALLKNYKIKGHVTMVELDVTALIDEPSSYPWQYKALTRYPASSFDCTVIVSADDQGVKPLEIIKNAKLPFVTLVQLANVFKLPSGERAITLRAQMQNEAKTLTSEEIKTTEDLIVSTLAKHGYDLKS